MVGPHPSAEPVARFEHHDTQSCAGQFPGGDQPGDAAADHDDIGFVLLVGIVRHIHSSPP